MKHNLGRVFTYIMLLLITAQSVTVVSDTHQFHQSGNEHLTFEYSDGQTENLSHDKPKLQLVQQSELNNYDCQHCCHCHGSTIIYLRDANGSSSLSNARVRTIGYQNSYHSLIFSPENPPPIS